MSQKDSGSLQHQAEHARSRRPSQVMVYLVILFAAAFLLLLMAYFQQQRQSAEATNDAIKQSASAVQSIQNLMADNEELRARVDELETQLAEVTEVKQNLEKEVQDYVYSSVVRRGELDAMDLFWQIDEAYVLGRYKLCRELIEKMEAPSDYLPLKEQLPTESSTDNGRFSPADRYQEIYDALY